MIEYSICKKCGSHTFRNTETGFLHRPHASKFSCRPGECVPIEWKPTENNKEKKS